MIQNGDLVRVLPLVKESPDMSVRGCEGLLGIVEDTDSLDYFYPIKVRFGDRYNLFSPDELEIVFTS